MNGFDSKNGIESNLEVSLIIRLTLLHMDNVAKSLSIARDSSVLNLGLLR
jgi:hypothetical protein